MTDELVLGASQDDQVVATPEAASGADDQPISRAEFMKALDALGDKLSKQVQSYSDKAEARLRKSVSDKLSQTIDDFGKEQKLDEDQIADLKKQFIHDDAATYQKTPETGSQPASRRASQPDQKSVEEVDDWIQKRLETTRVPILVSDPEYNEVNWSTTTPPETFMEQYLAAEAKVAARKGWEIPAEPPAPTRSPGRVGGGMAGNRIEQLTKELLDLQYSPDALTRANELKREKIRAELEVLQR